ncbi:MAG: pentapeptide repeat-containing protein [Actinomycetia bacterium]|nr:pentapeptide repeat-containing protein [Actinomycetes bacterium]
MVIRRISTIAAALGLLAASCGGGGTTPSGAADLELTTSEPEVAIEADIEVDTVDRALAGVDMDIEAALELAVIALDELALECENSEAEPHQNSDLSNRVFTGPDVRCVDFSGTNLENAVLEGVDLSGANFAGANLTGAKLDVIAMGADFTNAIIDGTDFGSSELVGARFAGATITATDFPDNPVSLSMADFTGAAIGCSRLSGGPGVILADVLFLEECTSSANYERITLGGSFYGADLRGVDLAATSLQTGDFRRSNLSGATFAGYGVLPTGADFSGSAMVGVQMSNNAIYDAAFVGADLTQAGLSQMLISGSDLGGAILDGADMSSTVSERNAYVGASFVGTVMSDASVSYDDFSGAVFEGVVAEGLAVDTISCPGAVSNTSFGLCLEEASERVF